MIKILLSLPLLFAFAACSRNPDPITLQRLDKLEQRVQQLDKDIATLSGRFEESQRPANRIPAFLGQGFDNILDEGKGTQSLAYARQIGLACKLFAGDHDGSFPKDLNELSPKYLEDRKVLSSPLAPRPGQVDYDRSYAL
jgi:hypothetical protein